MPREFRFKVLYNEAMLKEGIKAVLRRRAREMGRMFWMVYALLSCLTAYFLWSGDRSWVVGILLSVIVLVPLVLFFLMRTYFQQTMGRFARMRRPEGFFALREDELSVSSDVGQSRFGWSHVIYVWEWSEAWIFFLAPGNFFFLPLAGVPPEALAFIREKVTVEPISP